MIPIKSKKTKDKASLTDIGLSRNTHWVYVRVIACVCVCVRLGDVGGGRHAFLSQLSFLRRWWEKRAKKKKKKEPTLCLSITSTGSDPHPSSPPHHCRRKQTSFVFPAPHRLPQTDTSQHAAWRWLTRLVSSSRGRAATIRSKPFAIWSCSVRSAADYTTLHSHVSMIETATAAFKWLRHASLLSCAVSETQGEAQSPASLVCLHRRWSWSRVTRLLEPHTHNSFTLQQEVGWTQLRIGFRDCRSPWVSDLLL